jgi:hypothetical protein
VPVFCGETGTEPGVREGTGTVPGFCGETVTVPVAGDGTGSVSLTQTICGVGGARGRWIVSFHDADVVTGGLLFTTGGAGVVFG